LLLLQKYLFFDNLQDSPANKYGFWPKIMLTPYMHSLQGVWGRMLRLRSATTSKS